MSVGSQLLKAGSGAHASRFRSLSREPALNSSLNGNAMWHCVALLPNHADTPATSKGQIRWKNHRPRRRDRALAKTLNLLVLGSTPSGLTNLRSRLRKRQRELRLASHAKVVHRSAQREGGRFGLALPWPFLPGSPPRVPSIPRRRRSSVLGSCGTNWNFFRNASCSEARTAVLVGCSNITT